MEKAAPVSPRSSVPRLPDFGRGRDIEFDCGSVLICFFFDKQSSLIHKVGERQRSREVRYF